MEPFGWVMMLISVGGVLSGASWCFYRILTLPPIDVEETIHGQPAIDTRDTLDAD